MRFNPHKNSFEMAPKDWPLQYNSHTEEWVFAPPEAVAKMNPHTGKKELVGKTWKLKYNPISCTWCYAP